MTKKEGSILIVEDDKVDKKVLKKFFSERKAQYDYVLTETVKEK